MPVAAGDAIYLPTSAGQSFYMCSGGDELQSLDEGLTNPSVISRHYRLQKPFPSAGQSRRFLITAVMQ